MVLELAPASGPPQRGVQPNVVSVPAPIQGLNARDPLSAMAPTYAIYLTNVFPDGNTCKSRRGYVSHATGLPGQVRSLIRYTALNGTEKLFAVAGGNIYDVTSAGAVGAPVVTALANNDFQYVNFVTGAGAFVFVVNGVDTPRYYDGTTWNTTAFNLLGPGGGGGGPAQTTIVNITSHKNRLWFLCVGHLSAWYAGTDAIAGNASKFTLSSVFKLGGQLVGIGTVSNDAGDTLDDYLAFISDQGEVAIYQGTDPGSASTWGLVGLYRIGEPIGRRNTTNLNGDLIVLTTDGATSVNSAIRFDRARQDDQSVTSIIRRLFSEAAQLYRSNFGWQMIVHPASRWFLINIPEVTGVRQTQFIMNTATAAWCQFVGLNANCWSLKDEKIFFGGNGIVYQADQGMTDNGAAYVADVKTAFNYFGQPGRLKRVTAIRPLLRQSASVPYGISVNYDFTDTGMAPASMSIPSSAMRFDVGQFDVNSFGGLTISSQVTGLSGLGNAAAVRITANVSGQEFEVISFDMTLQGGGYQ